MGVVRQFSVSSAFNPYRERMMPMRIINMGVVRQFSVSSAASTINTITTKARQAKILLACFLLAISASAIGADDPQKTLDFIDFKKLPDNGVEIRIALSDKAPNPTDFTSKNPARISLDLPGVNNNLPWSLPLPIDTGVAKNIKAVQAKGRTRVIISVDKLVTYQLRTEGKNIFLTLGNNQKSDDVPAAAAKTEPAPLAPVAKAAPQPAPTSKPAPRKKTSAKKGPSLESVTFTSLPGDSVQVRLSFSGPVANPGNFTINNPARIVLDFPALF
jgi:type IV pilus assembly protein PilQ